MSQERPGTNFMMASEIDAAGPYSEASLIVSPNKTMTSKFKIIPSFNSNAGIPLTDPLEYLPYRLSASNSVSGPFRTCHSEHTIEIVFLLRIV